MTDAVSICDLKRREIKPYAGEFVYFDPVEEVIHVRLYKNNNTYPIEFHRLEGDYGSKEVMDFIFQISRKPNCTPEILKEFIECLDRTAELIFGTCGQGAWVHGGCKTRKKN